MGKKSQPSPPPAPDPSEIGATAFGYNNLNQQTPWGSLSFTAPVFGEDGSTILQQGSANLELTPELQQLFNSQLGISQGSLDNASARLAGVQQGNLPGLISGINWGDVRDLPTDFSADRRRVEDAIFSRNKELLDPVFAQQNRNFSQDIANSGHYLGDEGGLKALQQLGTNQNEALQRAAMDAISAGGQEQSRMFDITRMARADDINSQLQDAGLASNKRATLMNELAQVLGNQQLQQPGMNSFFSPGMTDTIGAYGIQQSALNNAYNAQSNMSSAKKGAGGQIGAALPWEKWF